MVWSSFYYNQTYDTDAIKQVIAQNTSLKEWGIRKFWDNEKTWEGPLDILSLKDELCSSKMLLGALFQLQKTTKVPKPNQDEENREYEEIGKASS